MPHEAAAEKAKRYLIEGRLRVAHVSDTTIRGLVEGSDLYRVGWDWGGDPDRRDGGEWFCTCPSRRRCSHVIALELVTAPHSEGRS